MSCFFPIDRRSPRRPLDVEVRIERRDGSVTDGESIDASDEGFGIAVGIKLNVGEILRITVGIDDAAPSFIACVVWQRGSRVGLYCVASKPMIRNRNGAIWTTTSAG
jgi:PilZ domain